VTVHFLPSDGTHDEVRVAYTIGRRVGGAVVRNRCRRRLRSIASEAAADLRPGLYLIRVDPEVRGLGFALLRERVMHAMRQAGERDK
jgi:ribonuclease P protein component